MTKHRRSELTCERLEPRALLSGAHAAAGHHAHIHAAAATHAAIAVSQASAATSVTGGGLLSVGPAPSSADTQSLQQAALTNNLMTFLTQLDELAGTNPGVQQVSGAILNDARNLDLAMWGTAMSLGVNLPADIEGNGAAAARQVALSVKGGSFDQTYEAAVTQAGTSLANQLQQMATGAQDAALRSLAATALPVVQADLAAAQAMSGGTGSATLAPVSASPSSTTLGATDLTTLETSYSMNQTERFLAEFTSLVIANPATRAYDDKLIADHEMTAVQEGMYAAATGTYLPAGIQGMDVANAMRIIGSSGTPRYRKVYLQQMVKMHTTDLANNQATIASTQNPVLKGFAMVGAATDIMHRENASSLLNRMMR